ncbi:hypothetical protein AAVH_11295 [Aphelenchoides avenae]|nr:hypothetical protein AAVH_11295 [Aphelenchus avenae]
MATTTATSPSTTPSTATITPSTTATATTAAPNTTPTTTTTTPSITSTTTSTSTTTTPTITTITSTATTTPGTTTVTTTTTVPTTTTQTPTTTTIIPTTATTSYPTTTATPCNPLNNATQVGLTVYTGVSDVGGSKSPVAECTSCPTGTRKFWQTGIEANPYYAFAHVEQAIAVNCTDKAKFCVCDEEGTCYSSGATAPTDVYFYPYCTTAGICHMYAVQRGPREASLVSTSKPPYTVGDQFKGDDDRSYYDMDPAPVTQVYIFASKVSCGGCANIESDTCTGPAIPVTG